MAYTAASCGPMCYFYGGEKGRVEGQVLWQAARLISSVLCQPPRKTLKSVMLTRCNTVTLYRHRRKRWEGGRDRRREVGEEAEIETEQEGWRKRDGKTRRTEKKKT